MELDKNLLGRIFNEEAEQFYKELLKTFRETIEKNKVRASDDLLNSLNATIIQASENAEGKVVFSFMDYGRIRDMRKLIYSSQPPVDLIKEWVESLGIEKFKYIPGYDQSKGFLSRDMAASRIAWGVAKSKFMKRIVTRTKKQGWYASPLFSAKNNLQNKMAKRYSDLIVQEMVKSTK